MPRLITSATGAFSGSSSPAPGELPTTAPWATLSLYSSVFFPGARRTSVSACRAWSAVLPARSGTAIRWGPRETVTATASLLRTRRPTPGSVLITSPAGTSSL